MSDSRTRAAGNASPVWWIVFTNELADLWIGGKGLILVTLYAIVLGVQAYADASNSELSLIPAKELVYETLKTAIAVGSFIGLIIGADSISGERERSTLESLLLTPTSRWQIVLGKFLAAMSVWPAALVITVPFFRVLAQGGAVFGHAVLWGVLLGSVMATAYTGLGMLVSFWSNSNKTSFFVCLGMYIFFLVPAQLPGIAQTGVTGQFLQWVNPLAAANHFLSKVLVNYRTLAEFQNWLTMPVAFAVLVVGLLFLYASPALRLEGGTGRRLLPRWGRVASLLLAACLVAFAGAPAAMAFQSRHGDTAPTGAEQSLQIAVDLEYKGVKAGDEVLFSTVVTNNGAEDSPPLTVAMNIVNLEKGGDPVDPEDWSPRRTQAIEPLAAGQSAPLEWTIDAILAGDYMVYMVLIPEPDSAETTSQPVASSGIHLTVEPFTSLNPGGVLPWALGVPLGMSLLTGATYWRRRRGIDAGGSE